MQAGVLGRGGEIFVLDMGEPVKIRYLAAQMIRLSGHGPEDIPVRYIGLRPGEKLYEELFYGDEDLAPTAHRRIRVARHRPPESQRLEQDLEAMQRLVRDFRSQPLREILQGLIPEWQGPAETQ